MNNAIIVVIICCSFVVAAEDDLIDFGNGELIITTTTSSPILSPNTCQWLAWSEWTACSDQCGSCGVHMRTRTCLTTTFTCTCEGESTLIEHCNLEICRYPRTTCCNNLKVQSLKGRFACLADNSK